MYFLECEICKFPISLMFAHFLEILREFPGYLLNFTLFFHQSVKDLLSLVNLFVEIFVIIRTYAINHHFFNIYISACHLMLEPIGVQLGIVRPLSLEDDPVLANQLNLPLLRLQVLLGTHTGGEVILEYLEIINVA